MKRQLTARCGAVPPRWLALAMAGAVVAAGVALTGPSSAAPLPAGAAHAAGGPVSPIASLPSGAAPRDTPYAIGKRVFLNGRTYDLTGQWARIAPISGYPGTRRVEFTDLDLSRGDILWSFSFTGVDEYGQVGNLRPGYPPKVIGRAKSTGQIAATTGGFTTLNSSQIQAVTEDFWTNDGRQVRPAFTDRSLLQVPTAYVGSAGPVFVINVPDSASPSSSTVVRYRSWAVRPTYAQQRLPLDNTYAAGVGWLATRDSLTSPCYRIAPLSAPRSLRAKVCSQVTPVASNDGTMVAVVQGLHVRLYSTATGAQVNATNAPTLGAWDPTHHYRVLRWEDASNYLVSARDGSNLYILRCNVNRGCQRAVTSLVRSGVSGIVT